MKENFCCPQCGNEELTVVNETNVQTSGSNYSATQGCLGYCLMGPLGLLCGSCGQGQQTTTTNTTYWICPKCGKKFRNPNDLQKDIEKRKNGMKTSAILFAIMAVIVMIPLVSIGEKDAIMMALGFAFYIGILYVIVYLISKKQISKIEDEIQEIKSGMDHYRK